MLCKVPVAAWLQWRRITHCRFCPCHSQARADRGRLHRALICAAVFVQQCFDDDRDIAGNRRVGLCRGRYCRMCERSSGGIRKSSGVERLMGKPEATMWEPSN
jgi:hypothetical protein